MAAADSALAGKGTALVHAQRKASGATQTIATSATRQWLPRARSFEQGTRGLPAGHHLAEAAAANGTPIHHDVGAVDE